MRLFLCIFVVGAVAFGSASSGAVLTGPVVNPANGHSYYLLTQNTWTASEAEAVALGGNLVTINDAAENDWVYNQFANFGGIIRIPWIGLYDPIGNESTLAQHAANFVWISGEPVTYTNWGPGEPNNSFDTENYGHIDNIDYGSGWNDLSDNYSNNPVFGVVEVPTPEPNSLSVVFWGLIALRLRARPIRVR